jgi:iron complex transport system ATP-binding protein
MILEGQNLEVRYPSAPRASLIDVSLRVQPGELVAILGPNGSGKSTLMKALLDVIPLTRGKVLLNGQPLPSWPRNQRARWVGAMSQSESVVFPIRVRELVAMGRYPHLGALAPEGPEDRDAVEQALAECGLTDLADRDVTELSGGEFQRARLARALAQTPRLLVLDEPTAQLDLGHEMQILEQLREATARGIGILWITHDLEQAARFSDRMILLKAGRVVAVGGADEVLRVEVLEEVYQWPVLVRPGVEPKVPQIVPRRSAQRLDSGNEA